MPTQRQKNLARAIVANMAAQQPKTMKELVVSSGYDTTTAEKQVPAVIEQKGVKEELARLGFTEFNAKSVVAGIMLDEAVEPNARLKAADMTFKVHGSYAPERSVSVSVSGTVKEVSKYQALKAKFEQELLNEIQDG